jgi:hypothetical protein
MSESTLIGREFIDADGERKYIVGKDALEKILGKADRIISNKNAEIEHLRAEALKVPVMDFDAAIRALRGIIDICALSDSIPFPFRQSVLTVAAHAHKAIGSTPKQTPIPEGD